MKQNRLKSTVAWGALAALIYFVAKDFCGFTIPGWDTFVTLTLAACVEFGILNNPTDKSNF